MQWNNAPALTVLAGLVLAAGPRQAHADAAPRCAPMAVAVDGNARRRWPDLPQRIQQAFEQRDHIDACARIEVTITETAVVLKVTLADGRTAARSVLRREDVLPALDALLLLPEIGATEAASPESTAPRTPAKPARVEPTARTEVVVTVAAPATATPPAEPGTRLRIELGLGVEARAGDGQMGAGLGVASFLELAHWLLGFQGRIDHYRLITGDASAMPGSGESTALELALLFGRRFELGSTALDVVAGPALAVHGGSSTSVAVASSTATPMPPPQEEENRPRLLVSSRLTFRAHSTLRTFVQLDGEIGRQRSAPDPLPGEADLPAWTVGLAIGATVGTR